MILTSSWLYINLTQNHIIMRAFGSTYFDVTCMRVSSCFQHRVYASTHSIHFVNSITGTIHIFYSTPTLHLLINLFILADMKPLSLSQCAYNSRLHSTHAYGHSILYSRLHRAHDSEVHVPYARVGETCLYPATLGPRTPPHLITTSPSLMTVSLNT